MKTLRKGRDQRGWAVETDCSGVGNGEGGCGARLLVEQDDLFLTQSHARDEVTSYVTFRCSECGVLTDLPENVSPPRKLRALLPTQAEWEKAHK